MKAGDAVKIFNVPESEFDERKLSQRYPSHRRLRKLRTAWLSLLEARCQPVLYLEAAHIRDNPAIFALRPCILTGIHFPCSLHSCSTKEQRTFHQWERAR